MKKDDPQNKPSKRLPSPWLSAIPLLILIGLLACVITVFGGDALSGGSQVALLITSACCMAVGWLRCGTTWADYEAAITEKISGVSQAILLLLLIGALGGIWMISGVVPTLIYYGMQIINPRFFLVSGCLISAVVSVMTGSSWTTVATIGVALMGIGEAQGFDTGWVAGAIISGAYFGDKVSPLSDTTVLAASVTGTPLFTHIRYMMLTTVPTFLLALAVFAVAGLSHTAADEATVQAFMQGLASTFNITPWLLIVPVLTVLMIARRMPSLVILFMATLLACVCALVFQPHLLDGISGMDGTLAGRFRGTMIAVYGSTGVDTGVADLNKLVSTRGMAGMMSTIWLIFCAMVFGGSMTASGMLESLMSVFVRFTRRTVSLVASTAGVGLFLNAVCADQYLSIILTGNMFKDVYRRQGYESRLLSRTTEDSVTVTSVLIPWNTCGMTQSTVLGVPTWTYFPYCVFNYLSPLTTILMAAIGFKIKRLATGKTAADTQNPCP